MVVAVQLDAASRQLLSLCGMLVQFDDDNDNNNNDDDDDDDDGDHKQANRGVMTTSRTK